MHRRLLSNATRNNTSGLSSLSGQFMDIMDEINNRPMRVFGYCALAEAFTDELLKLADG